MTATAELQLVYDGAGRFHCATKLDLQMSNERFGQGEIIEVVPAKRRSRKQHGWFFAMLDQAYECQSTGPEFRDVEHMRKWLLVRAGHCDIQTFAHDAVTPEAVAFLKSQCRDVFWYRDSRHIYAKVARSVSIRGPNAIDHWEMTRVANVVVDVIMADLVPGSKREYWEPYLREGETRAEKKDRVKSRTMEGIAS